MVLLACYGALDTVELSDGESVTIDSGHVVAFGPGVTSQIRKIASGVVQMLKSGEGLVFDFTGPGWVMTQTRNPSALEAWIRQLAPGQTGGATAACSATCSTDHSGGTGRRLRDSPHPRL